MSHSSKHHQPTSRRSDLQQALHCDQGEVSVDFVNEPTDHNPGKAIFALIGFTVGTTAMQSLMKMVGNNLGVDSDSIVLTSPSSFEARLKPKKGGTVDGYSLMLLGMRRDIASKVNSMHRQAEGLKPAKPMAPNDPYKQVAEKPEVINDPVFSV